MKLLDEKGIKWSGTRERGSVGSLIRIKEGVFDTYDFFPGDDCYDWVTNHVGVYNEDKEEDDCVTGEIEDEDTFRYHPLVIEWMKTFRPDLTEQYETILTGRKLNPREKAESIRKFQEGEVQCFLLKTTEGKAITLNRVPALKAGISSQPELVLMTPDWEYGIWEQDLARADGVDPRTGTSIVTVAHVMIIARSLEATILDAIKRKRSFKDFVLRDLDRDGAINLLEQMLEDMEGYGDGETFDSKDPIARAHCGITPYGRLTRNVIETKPRKKYGFEGKKNDAAWVEFLENNPDVAEAQAYLLGTLQ